jgi:hypothetical protein
MGLGGAALGAEVSLDQLMATEQSGQLPTGQHSGNQPVNLESLASSAIRRLKREPSMKTAVEVEGQYADLAGLVQGGPIGPTPTELLHTSSMAESLSFLPTSAETESPTPPSNAAKAQERSRQVIRQLLKK